LAWPNPGNIRSQAASHWQVIDRSGPARETIGALSHSSRASVSLLPLAPLARARKTLRVRAVKDGFDGGWLLTLPDEECQDRPKSATQESGSLR